MSMRVSVGMFPSSPSILHQLLRLESAYYGGAMQIACQNQTSAVADKPCICDALWPNLIDRMPEYGHWLNRGQAQYGSRTKSGDRLV